MIDRRAVIDYAPKGASAHGQFMANRACVEAAAEGRLHLVVTPRVVWAAEVVNVVIAFRAEVITDIGCHAAHGAAAPRKRAVIINHHFAARGTQAAFPVIAKTVFEVAVEVQRVNGDWLCAALVCQQFFGRGMVRQFRTTQ